MSAEPLKLTCPHCGKKLKLPDRSILGKKVRCPACQAPFVAELAASDPSPPPDARQTPLHESPASDPGLPEQIQIVINSPHPYRRSAKRLSAKRRSVNVRGWGFVVGGSVAVGLSLIVYFLVFQPSIPIQKQVVSGPAAEASSPPDRGVSPRESDVPLTLHHLPGGIRLLVHLRPYDLLQGGRGSREILQVTGTSGEWFARRIREITFADLEEIDELLLGWILGGAGDPPQLVCRVKRRPELTDERLAARLGPDFQPGTGGAWRQSTATAVWLVDERTCAIVPVELSNEVPEAARTPLPTDLGVEEVLQRSTANDQIVIVGIPHDLRIHRAVLSDPGFELGWDAVLGFLEQEHRHAEVFAVSSRWSHSGTEVTLRIKGSNTAKMNNVRSVVETRLAELPGLAQRATTTDRIPSGFLAIARRFPSMLRNVQELCQFEVAGRQIVVRSQLPERALPNLLLGGILLWHNQIPIGSPPREPAATPALEPVSPPSPDSKPLTIAELLQKLIDVDFRREPLEGALQTISAEIGRNIEIDGDALKLAGYTRNMPQTMQLERFPAGGVLQKILVQYDQMALAIIDGTPETLLLTTKESARQKQLRTLQLEIQIRTPKP